ncbi:hypothetical protein [Methanofollis fontis]|uniref:Uncharacterized protein n=1 Tax=Methanofollis fontis TaxID=2052832 RepID=A0A483CTE9_9EURY|nr:hypothetical protein [Methanofollis fontis]TAJ44633.1 hypothetical protein CUJ86_04825 [Methanofollis fontis]
MDPKTAVLQYQYGEKAKSELILASRLIAGLTGFSDADKVGGRKMLLLLLEGIRSELEFASKSTENPSFGKSIEALNGAISMVEGSNDDEAIPKVAEAVSAATTVAQESWEALVSHGLL